MTPDPAAQPGPASSAFASVSVVTPAYNAAAEVGATLESIHAWLLSRGIEHELIVVDDGSSDGTGAAAARWSEGRPAARFTLLRNPENRGKGYSVRRGMLRASKDWALFMDVDNSTTIDHLDRFAPLAARAPVLIASRRLPDSVIVRRQALTRRILGGAFPYIVRAISRTGATDTQCGFKMFRSDAARDIFSRQRTERFAFDVELLLLARKLGHGFAEAPARWDNPPDASTVKIRWDTVNMMLDVLRCTWRLRRGAPTPDPLDPREVEPDTPADQRPS